MHGPQLRGVHARLPRLARAVSASHVRLAQGGGVQNDAQSPLSTNGLKVSGVGDAGPGAHDDARGSGTVLSAVIDAQLAGGGHAHVTHNTASP